MMGIPDAEVPWLKRTVIRPVSEFEHDAVSHAQRVMRCPVNGEMDEVTVSHLRGLQRLFGIRVTGVLDKATAQQIDRLVIHAVHSKAA